MILMLLVILKLIQFFVDLNFKLNSPTLLFSHLECIGGPYFEPVFSAVVAGMPIAWSAAID